MANAYCPIEPLHGGWWTALDEPTIVHISPGMANQLLAANVKNRTSKPTVVERYAREMRNGAWMFNGESIIIGVDGSLLDGQHRLLALLASGVTLPFLVVFGIGPDSQFTIDTGSARTGGDVMTIEGVPNANTVSAVCRLVYSYERSGVPSTNALNPKDRPTPQDLLGVLERHPAVAEHSKDRGRMSTMTKTEVALCSYVFTFVDHPGEPLLDLCTRSGNPQGHPARALQDKLLADGMSGKRTIAAERIAVAFRAHNAYATGRKLTLVKGLIGQGTLRERFPSLDKSTFPFFL